MKIRILTIMSSIVLFEKYMVARKVQSLIAERLHKQPELKNYYTQSYFLARKLYKEYAQKNSMIHTQ
jgi:hypothetical protein